MVSHWQESTDLDIQVIEDRQKDGFKHNFIKLIDQAYFRWVSHGVTGFLPHKS